MNRLNIFLATLCLSISSSALAQSGWVVWSQPQNTTYAIVPAYASTSPPMDVEVADDFEVNGSVKRIVVDGYDCFNCGPMDVAGVYVRFYAWTPTAPGALLSETFIPDGGPGLLYDPEHPAALDITLPTPFAATGKHFISVQIAFSGWGEWDWWITNRNSPQGALAQTRDRAAGADAPWSPLQGVLGPLNSDVALMLWGDDGNPPPPGTDPCGNWSVVATPNPAGTDHAILRDVAAISDDDVWAVGEYTATVDGVYQTFTMVEHWNGTTWTLVPSPNPAACSVCTHATFDAVAAAGPNDIWAAGGKRVQAPDGFVGTHVFVARYNGSDWTVTNTPLTIGGSGAHVNDIEIIAPDDIWFFGEWVGAIPGGSYPPTGTVPALAMHWNGSSFTVTPTPFPSGGTPGWGLEAGSAVAPDDIWAVGGGSDGDYTGLGYLVHWDGKAWTRVIAPTPGTYQRLWDVKAIASDDVWAIGDYFEVGEGYFPLFLHWDGSTWTQVESPGGGASIVAFSSNNIYSGGAGIVHWDGSAWQQVEVFNSVIGPSVTSISAAGLCDMWAVGRQIIVGDILNFSAHLQTGAVGEFTVAGDVTGDGIVNVNDLLAVIGGWGPCAEPPALCPADVTGDGVVDVNDLLLVIGTWS